MIRFAVADLVVVAAEALGLDADVVLDVIDLDAAAQALADPVPTPDDPDARAAALLHGLLEHRPLPRGNRRVAVLATAQFLAVNGWQVDLEPAEELLRVLRTACGPADLAAWLRPRLCAASTTSTTFTRAKGTAMFGRKREGSSRSGGTGPAVRWRLGERARRVIVLAREEARLQHNHYAGTEHLLLGLIHEGDGVAARTLRSFDVDLEQVRGWLQRYVGHDRDEPVGRIPLTPHGERALDLAVRAAVSGRVGTEHVLVGVVDEGDGLGARALVELGLDLREVRERVLRLAAEADPAAERPGAGAAGDAIEENTRLRREVRRLRTLLSDAGIDPDAGVSRSA